MTLTRRRRVVHIAGAAALLTIGLGFTARSARAGDSAEAEALIRQGVELRAQKKDERALPLFEKAYQISRSPRTAGQLGLVVGAQVVVEVGPQPVRIACERSLHHL